MWQEKNKVGCCYDCAERHEGCHGTCEKYLSAKKEYEEERQAIRKRKISDKIYADTHVRNVAQTCKVLRGKGRKV